MIKEELGVKFKEYMTMSVFQTMLRDGREGKAFCTTM